MLKALLKKELMESVRNRWLILYILLFAGLGIGFAYYSSMGLSVLGFRMFGRVTAAMVNMNLYLVPLLAMFLTGLSVVSERERGTLEFLLSQPVSRLEVIVSKYLGTFASVVLATFLGYGITAWYLWFFLSATDLAIFLQMLGSSILLTAVFSAIGMAIGVLSRSRFQALATILTVWFFALIVFDMLLMAVIMITEPRAPFVFAAMALNPAENARLLMMYSIDPTLLVLGPISTYVAREIGSMLPILLLATQLAWLTALLLLSTTIFNRQDI